MKIKDTLDLCGWELWNFCIQNHQNLEGLLDLGAGRKVFYTGNDQGKNGREVIYDGSKWKVSAYTSDVEGVQSNLSALTDRVNAFLDGEVNSNEVLDNLKEIQAFLDAYPEATSLVQILDTKLDKTGGTIKKAEEDNAPLFIENVGTSWAGIGFKNKNGILGFLGANDDTPVFVDSSFASHTLLHSGNYSDLITTLNGDLSIGGAVNVGTGGLRVQGNLNVPIEINGSSIKRYGRGGGYLLSDDYYGLTPTKRLVQVGVFANDDNLEFYCIGNRIESSAGGERWFTINSASSAFYVPTSFSSGITTNELTIGGIRLSVENGLLKIEGSAFATGELAAGGAATEGEGGAGGFSLYESWGTSAPTEPLALGANLGYELKTRVEDLELAKTKVTFEPALVSGKPIGAIEIDGNKTNLFAPATYAWSEITGTENVLLKSGGIIKGTGADLLGINRTDGYPTIVFYHNNSTMGRLGFDTSGNPVAQIGGTYYNILTSAGGTIKGDIQARNFVFGTYNDVAWGKLVIDDSTNNRIYYVDKAGVYNTLIHSVNVGEYNAGGIVSDVATDDYLQGKVAKVWYDWNAKTGNGVGDYSYGIYVGAYDSGYAMQLATTIGSVSFLRTRVKRNSAWEDWKTIAFTDSDITGNAGSATKLATPRTIWGQSFDGTENVSGVLKINGSYIAGNGEANIIDSQGEWLILGSGVANKEWPTYIDGNNISLRYGKSHTTAMHINSSGNVTIGESDLATSANGNPKLYVDGGATINAFNSKGEEGILGAKTESSFFLGKNYGLQLWTNGYGNVYGQVGRIDGTPTAYNLILQHLGGNVLIGTTEDNGAKLQVKGDVKLLSNEYWQTEYTTISAIGVAYYGRTSGGYTQGASFYDYNKAEIAFAGAYANSSGLINYIIGKNISLPWFTINAEKSEFKVLTSFAAGAKSSYLEVNGTSAFYGSTTFGKEGVSMQVNFKCPVVAEDRVTIGGATLRWDDEIKALRLNTSLAATGEVSAGGAGTEGGNTGGGGTGTIASPFSRTFTPNEKTSFTFSHDLPYYDVVVQVYEWDSSGMCWNMVLADIEIQNNDVTVTLGRKENVEHKIVVR